MGSVAVSAGSMSGASSGAAVGSVLLGAGDAGSVRPGVVASIGVAGDAASVGVVRCRSASVVIGAGAGPVAGVLDRTGVSSTPGAGADRASPEATTIVVVGTTMRSSGDAAACGVEHPSGMATLKAATTAKTSDRAGFMIGPRRHPGPPGLALSAPADHATTITTTRQNASTPSTTTTWKVCPGFRAVSLLHSGRWLWRDVVRIRWAWVLVLGGEVLAPVLHDFGASGEEVGSGVGGFGGVGDGVCEAFFGDFAGDGGFAAPVAEAAAEAVGDGVDAVFADEFAECGV